MTRAVCSTDFVPLTTKQGLHPEEVLQRLNGRGLTVWGSGHLGRAMMRVFRKFSGPDTGFSFCDRRAGLIGSRIDGLPVQSTDATLDAARNKLSMIVVATSSGAAEIVKLVERNGLRMGDDVITFRRVARPEASIEVVRADQSMSLLAYGQAIRKLVREIPHLLQVELLGDPDPQSHPGLPSMIEATREHVPCVVTSTLDGIGEEVLCRTLRSRPGMFVVRVDGNRPDWEEIRTKLVTIAMLRDEAGSDTEFRVNYVRHRADAMGAPALLKKVCAEAGIALVVSHSYVEPYDRILDYCRGTPPASETKSEIERLSWDLDEALEFARIDRSQPCLCQRIFPVISHDLSVKVCHLYERHRVAADFLSQPYEQLIEQRHDLEHCRECQEHALHRLDVDVLKSRHQSFVFPGEERC